MYIVCVSFELRCEKMSYVSLEHLDSFSDLQVADYSFTIFSGQEGKSKKSQILVFEAVKHGRFRKFTS